MRQIIILCLCLILSAPLAAANAEEHQTEEILSNILTDYIRPSYADFAEKAEAFRRAAHGLCADPASEKLGSAQRAFKELATSWAHVEWLRVGPVMSQNRLERILFYPDRKSTGLKQVQRALAKQEETVLSAINLSEKSVAMQGLGAAEFLLFGTGSEALATSEASFRCNYAKAVSENIESISEEIIDGWKDGSELATVWVNPSQDNPLYRTEQEAMNTLIGTLVHGLEAVKDVRVGAFLKDEAKKDRPKSAVLWRSASTLPMVEADIDGLYRLWQVSGMKALLPEDSNLPKSIEFDFSQSIKTAASFDKPIADHLAHEEDRQRLNYLKLTIGFIIERFNDEYASLVGLKTGFSFGDGD